VPRLSQRLCGILLAVFIGLFLSTAACGSDDPAVVKADAIRHGDALMTQKQFGDAASAYLIAVQIDPRNAELRLKLAKAHEAAEQWEDASRQYITVAELRPDDWSLQIQAIRWMLALSRFTDAADRARALLKSKPDDGEVLVLLGCAKARLRLPEIAIAELEPVLRRGEPIESARKDLRPNPSAADDRAAEAAYRRAYALAPDRAGTRVALAAFLWAAGDANEGAALIRIAADQDPGDVRLNRVLGLFYDQRGVDSDAEKYFKAAALRDRESAMVLTDFYIVRNRLAEALDVLRPFAAAGSEPGSDVNVRVAEVERRQRQYAQAGQRADAVLAREPANGRALGIKAHVLFAGNDFVRAVEFARRALAAGPRSPETRLLLARSLAAAGYVPAAIDEYSAIWRENPTDAVVAKELGSRALDLGRCDVATEFGRHSARLDPTDRQTHLSLARALVCLRDFAAAERSLAPLLAGHSTTPDVLLLLATIQSGRGERDTARNTYARVLQADPESFHALAGLVEMDLEDGQGLRIRPRVEQAAARHPREPAYLILAARLAQATHDHSRADVLLQTILQLDPAHEQAAVLLADGLAQRGRRDEAIRVLEQTLPRRPASLHTQLSLAILLEATGRRADAIARYERLLSDHPRAAPAAYRLAALYAAAGERLDRALDLASIAKQALPQDAAVCHTLGWVHLSRDLPASALPHLIDAVRSEPNNALYRYHLGLAYLRTGSPQNARSELTRALEIDSRFSHAAEAREALSSIGR
jgi:tetratricopeptide (TPR) repeat protein